MKIQLTADLEESDLARLFPDGDPFTRRCVVSEIVGLLQSKLQDCKDSASIQAHEELGQAPAPAAVPPRMTAAELLANADTKKAGAVYNGDTILEDMACPKCGCRGPFNIAGYAIFEVESDTSSDIGDHTWEDSSACTCSDCQYGATVDDFTFPLCLLLIGALGFALAAFWCLAIP